MRVLVSCVARVADVFSVTIAGDTKFKRAIRSTSPETVISLWPITRLGWY